jgi:hypothetical protein
MKRVWFDMVELWKQNRKEFWDLWGGFALIVFWMWVTFGFLIPVFG